MKKQLLSITLCLITIQISAQKLVDFHTGQSGSLNFNFEKIDDFYYQMGVFDDNVTVGCDSESQVITEVGNNIRDQIYMVKYDLDFNIVWATSLGLTNNASKLQMKHYKDYIYIFWAQIDGSRIWHTCHRININDPEDVDYMLRFESSVSNVNYTFEISDEGALAVAGTYNEFIKFSFNGQPDEEYFCNSEQNLFLVRYSFLGSNASYSHIVQREWGIPGSNKRDFYGIKFDDNENIHLFGYGEGSVQLDGNLGEAIGQPTPFQVSYSPSNELLQFKENEIFFFLTPLIIPIENNNHAFVGGFEYSILDQNIEIISSKPIEYNSNSKVIDVAISDDSFTAIFEYRPSLNSLSLGDFTFKTNTLDYVVINYDFNGKMNWYEYFGGDSQSDIPISIDYLDNGNLVICGNTDSSLDIDPSYNVLKYDYQVDKFFVAEYSTECNGLSTGIKELSQITCNENAQLEFGINGGSKPYEFYFDNQIISDYSNVEVSETGVYSAAVIDDDNCSTSIFVPITGPSINPEEKLRLHQHAQEFRTGFDTEIFYSLTNENCIPKSGKIRITLDDEMEYTNASISPTLIDDKILEFEYNDLLYQESIFKLDLHLKISEDAVFGDQICARIQVFDEIENEIDRNIICREVINSFDPNDISVSPYGRCEENYFLESEPLEYTIRFQNLGNAEAINIEIVDTLSIGLDILSFVQTGTSHEAIVYIEEDSILIINYKDIYLPAKEQDEPASNGYFSYQIKTKQNQNLPSKIFNRAAIFFDFNDPVITNRVSSTPIDLLPECITTSVKGFPQNQFICYPNPAFTTLTVETEESPIRHVELFDLTGKAYPIRVVKNQNKLIIDVSRLDAGMYFIKLNEGIVRFYKNE